mgnify:CR=1 FL=1
MFEYTVDYKSSNVRFSNELDYLNEMGKLNWELITVKINSALKIYYWKRKVKQI